MRLRKISNIRKKKKYNKKNINKKYVIHHHHQPINVPTVMCHSRFTHEEVAEASQIFHRDAQVLPKLFSNE
jgi:hypothetical protein